MTEIPVLDIGSLSTERAPAGVVDDIDRAAAEFGFFQIVGHGVPAVFIRRVGWLN